MSLEETQRDALTELIGIGLGRAAEVLNIMLSSHIGLSAPSIRVIHKEELERAFAKSTGTALSAVEMRYNGAMSGAVELVFASVDANKLVGCISGEQSVRDEGVESLRAGALCEIGNIVVNALIGTMSNLLTLDLSYTVPSYLEGDSVRVVAQVNANFGAALLLADIEFFVENLGIFGKIAIVFSLGSLENLTAALSSYAKVCV